MITDPKKVEDSMNKIFAKNIENYISRKTNWRIGRESTIVPKPELTFRELFVVLKWGRETRRVALKEIEGY